MNHYDDIKNGIDNVIIDKKTGNVVCAVDDVGDMTRGNIKYEKKSDTVLGRLREGKGGTLKYGLSFEKGDKGGRKLVRKEVRDIPILYIALSPESIREFVRKFTADEEEKSPKFEKKIFEYVGRSLLLEIDDNIGQVKGETLRASLSQFRKTLKEYCPK